MATHFFYIEFIYAIYFSSKSFAIHFIETSHALHLYSKFTCNCKLISERISLIAFIILCMEVLTYMFTKSSSSADGLHKRIGINESN